MQVPVYDDDTNIKAQTFSKYETENSCDIELPDRSYDRNGKHDPVG